MRITRHGRGLKGDLRGSTIDRRRRREWMVATFARGPWIYCHHCPRRMRAKGTVWQVDRWPLCGHAGGRYTRVNIVPACPDCNQRRCVECRRKRQHRSRVTA